MKKMKRIVAMLLACTLLCACADPTEATTEVTASEQEQVAAEESTTSTEASAELQSHTQSATEKITEPSTTETQPTESTTMEAPVLTTKVPEGLQTLLKDSFEAGTSAQTLTPMVIDKVVEREEWHTYRGLGVDDMLDYLDIWGGLLLRADADNDGIEDLFAWMRDGGSSGNTSFWLAKGKENGTYEVTEEQGSMSSEIAFIEYEGQNYLLETEFEYNRKAVNGFLVTAYEQGLVSDSVYLEAIAKVWEPETVHCLSGYEALTEQYAESGKDGFHDESLYDYRVDAGSAEWIEQNEKTIYHADINNDGVEEWYEKYIFYPSSVGAYICIEDKLYFADAPNEQEMLTSYYDFQYEGIPMTFWVEEVILESGQTKNVVCLFTYEGLFVNRVYGYLIEGESVTEVFEIEYEGQLEWK